MKPIIINYDVHVDEIIDMDEFYYDFDEDRSQFLEDAEYFRMVANNV